MRDGRSRAPPGRPVLEVNVLEEVLAMELARGPVGDPDSDDPFEWAQARMPDGWHVEGQHLNAYFASRRRGTGHQFAWGRTPHELVDNVVHGRQFFRSWEDVRRAAW